MLGNLFRGTAHGAPPAARGSRVSNVLLITIDALRREALGCFSADGRSTSPHIDHVAARGVVFPTCTAHVPLTPGSHASILTGLFPPHHGLRRLIGHKLGAGVPTAAELLAAGGVGSFAVVAADALHHSYGLGRGFAVYDDNFRRSRSMGIWGAWREADEVTAVALEQVRSMREPWFGFLHYFDVHDQGEKPTLARQRRTLRRVDRALGRLLRALRDSGALERTALILTADHGDTFDEHDEYSHGMFVFDSTILVPLILSLPGQHHRLVRTPVQHVDIAPTVLELLGVPAPAAAFDGVPLLPIGLCGADPVRCAYLETTDQKYEEVRPAGAGAQPITWGVDDPGEIRASYSAVRTGAWKLVRDRLTNGESLYDLRADRTERTNVLDRHRETADDLRAWLNEIESGAVPPCQMSPEEQAVVENQLRKLGYLA
jgi:arylsulfatase A-like enzyme